MKMMKQNVGTGLSARRGTRRLCSVGMLAMIAGSIVASHAAAQTVFYSENFDTAVLNRVSNDPRVTNACAGNVPSFTHTPPPGWAWKACGVSSFGCRTVGCPIDSAFTCATCSNNEGVLEWEGWSFANKAFWVRVAGDQNRSEFTLGVGNVAVADPDEWDDRGNPDQNCGYYSTFMTTPSVNLSTADLSTVAFAFDSSWRPEGFDDPRSFTNNQTATIKAVYVVGGVAQPAVEVMRWDSEEGGIFFKPDATNESVVLDASMLQIPQGATSVRLEMGLSNAGNDWWWALDNLVMSGDVSGTPTVLMSENFEGVALEAPVHEVPSGCGVTYCGEFTHTHDGPNGVLVTVDSPASGGVNDWFGWSFVDRPFWVCASGGPNGSAFTNSSGKVAVADGDEYDDLAHPPGPLNTVMATPLIDISARSGSVLAISFDSSWRFESGQTASLIAEYDDGSTQEVIRWESDQASAFFKGDAVNERFAAGLAVPQGVNGVTLKFRYIGGNNWWWAVDNISLFEGEATVNVASLTPTTNPMAVAPSIDYAPCFTPWSPTAPAGWTQEFVPQGSCPMECGRPEWRGWAIGFKDWWSTRVDDQLRSEFALGTGYVAIADPDEWDDFANGQSEFNAFMTTPLIALPLNISDVSLGFASSWRPEGFDDSCSCAPSGAVAIINFISAGNPAQVTTDAAHGFANGTIVNIINSNSVPSADGTYSVTVTGPTTFTIPVEVTVAGSAGSAVIGNSNNQTAKVNAIYTVGGVEQAPVTVLHWDSDSEGLTPGNFFHPDNTNEQVTLDNAALSVPANAQAVRFEFSLTEARNDWWWAIDNLDFTVNGTQAFAENFENPGSLQAAPTENPPVTECAYFSTVAAQGANLTVDNSLLTNCIQGDDFYGFNAWVVDAWSRALGGLRTGHLASTAFISDFAARGCNGTARLTTSNFSVASLNASTLSLSFRSGWENEAGHASSVEVSFNGGAFVSVLNWNASNKATTVDEIVTIALDNPQGASTVRLRFNDAESGWWAVSQVELTGIVGSIPCAPCAADFDNSGGVDGNDVEAFFTTWASGAACGDVDLTGGVDGNDVEFFFGVWSAGGC